MARSDIKDLIDKIHKLPPLNLVVQKLLRVANDDRSSAAEITKILSSDQAIAGKVLELVNSSFYGYTSKISTISRAVVILGNKAIQSLALAFATIDAFKNHIGALEQERFWSHSINTAFAAQFIASESGYAEPEEAFVAGLLHDMGQLLLASFFPDEYQKVLDRKGDIIKEEYHVFKFTHTEAAGLLLDHWQLPAILSDVVRKHHMQSLMIESSNHLLCIIGAAELLTKVKGNCMLDSTKAYFDYQILKMLDITEYKYKTILQNIDRAMGQSQQVLNIPIKNNKKISTHYDQEVCILGTSHRRIEWVKALVDYMGYTPCIMAIDSAIALENSSFVLCIVDPSVIPDDRILELILRMSKLKIKIAFLSTEGYHDEREKKSIIGFTELPYCFTRKELQQAIGEK